MTRRTLAAALLTFAGLALSAASLYAAPPTDEQVAAAAEAMKQKMDELRKANAGTWSSDDLVPVGTELLKDLSVSEMTTKHFQTLRQVVMFSDKRDEARKRLTELAAAPDLSGAEAAVMALGYTNAKETPAAEYADAIRLAARHPAIAEAIASGSGGSFFWNLRSASDEAKTLAVADLDRLSDLISPELSMQSLSSFRELLKVFVELGPDHDAARERLRSRLADAVSKVQVEEGSRDARGKEVTLASLEGAYAKGKLFTEPLPELTIEWSSDPALKSFADLKGKVVVIDFWATWCGPCIGSFPDVQKLVSHYEGYPVVVIGLTSLQGAHFGADGKIDTKDDPEKEYSLMREFIAQKEMTWPVVFTEQHVFNNDFGITGIPHVAIIDPSGKVRYNGLHAGGPLEGKTSKIDPLLREAGLPTPSDKH